MWWRSSGLTVFFLELFAGSLFAVAAGLFVGFSVFGALTVLDGIGAASIVDAAVNLLAGVAAVFFVATLLVGGATTTFWVASFLAGVVLAAGVLVVFLLLEVMAIP